MFSKDTEKLGSSVGIHSEFRGERVVLGIIRIEGSIAGKVQADQVVLGEAATMEGEVLAERAILGGKVEGNIRALEHVEIRSQGKVRGNIFMDNLSVKEGAGV